MLWIKHAPRNSSELVGQEVSKVKQALLSKKPVLIYGPSGTGKTITAFALAEELGYDLLEFNASDERGAAQMSELIGNACINNSLFGKRLILIDDVDALSDRGGVAELIKCLNKTKVPIIITATDVWSSKLSTLRKACLMVEYKPLRINYVLKVLRSIIQKEKLNVKDSILYQIASQSGGDLRAAINDLELSISSEETIIDSREKEDNVFKALQVLFKTSDFNEAAHSFDNVNMDFSEMVLWITENIPKEYLSINEVAKAFDHASRADVFLGRIRKWQHWRFLVYFNALITAGVSSAKHEPRKGFVPYKRPARILKLWSTKSKREIAKSIAEKLGSNCHLSISKAKNEFLPFLRLMIKDKQLRQGLINDLELTDKEVEFIK